MTFSELIAKAENAKRYQALRAEFPAVRAADIVGFIKHDGHESNPVQYACHHQWSSGYFDDGDYERECMVVCIKCGLSGDI